MHTTNRPNCFITISADCPACGGLTPPCKTSPSIARLTYDLLAQHPYELTSDDVIFEVWAQRNQIASHEKAARRQQFFSKGQPCLRTSDLCRRYGWGVHSDENCRLAIYGVDSTEYRRFVETSQDPSGLTIQVIAAMRGSKA